MDVADKMIKNWDVKKLVSYAGSLLMIASLGFIVRRIFLTPYPYLIDYVVGADEVIVLRFRHTSRNPTSIPGRAQSIKSRSSPLTFLFL